jgi:hypothetical protein
MNQVAKTAIQDITIQTIQSPEIFSQIASQVQAHVKENKLTSNIKGKDYPQVEAWQFAGGLLGIYPRLKWLKDLSVDNTYKYWARVDLIDIHTGKKLGSGEAVCTNKEGSKRGFDEYAIASMAQTRAIGKAFRMQIGWVMKAAGFNATSAEEMEADNSGENSNDPKWYQVMDQFKRFAIEAVSSCETAGQIHDLVKIAEFLKTDKDFIDTARAQYQALSDEIK